MTDKLLSSLELELKCLSARRHDLPEGVVMLSARHRRENRLVQERTDGVTPRPRRNGDEGPRRFTHAVEFSKIDAGRVGQQKDLRLTPEAHG